MLRVSALSLSLERVLGACCFRFEKVGALSIVREGLCFVGRCGEIVFGRVCVVLDFVSWRCGRKRGAVG